jgi:hypothetical protein
MAGGTIYGTVSRNSSKFTFYVVWASYREDAYNRHRVVVSTYLSTSNVAYDFEQGYARNHWISCAGQVANLAKMIDCSPDWPNGNPYLIQQSTFYVAYTGYGTMQIVIDAYADCTASTWGADACNIAATTVSLDNVPQPAPDPIPATTGTLELGNIYRDGINARVINLVSGYAAVRTFTWYYKRTADSTYIQVPNAVTTLASGAATTVSEWCTQLRGLLSALTSYDIKCVVTFSNGAPTLTLTGTAVTTDDKFEIVIQRINDWIILVPQITIPVGSKISVFKAPDAAVRTDLEADVWEHVITHEWADVEEPEYQLSFSVGDDYTYYDYKVVITNASDVITYIVFMED